MTEIRLDRLTIRAASYLAAPVWMWEANGRPDIRIANGLGRHAATLTPLLDGEPGGASDWVVTLEPDASLTLALRWGQYEFLCELVAVKGISGLVVSLEGVPRNGATADLRQGRIVGRIDPDGNEHSNSDRNRRETLTRIWPTFDGSDVHGFVLTASATYAWGLLPPALLTEDGGPDRAIVPAALLRLPHNPRSDLVMPSSPSWTRFEGFFARERRRRPGSGLPDDRADAERVFTLVGRAAELMGLSGDSQRDVEKFLRPLGAKREARFVTAIDVLRSTLDSVVVQGSRSATGAGETAILTSARLAGSTSFDLPLVVWDRRNELTVHSSVAIELVGPVQGVEITVGNAQSGTSVFRPSHMAMRVIGPKKSELTSGPLEDWVPELRLFAAFPGARDTGSDETAEAAVVRIDIERSRLREEPAPTDYEVSVRGLDSVRFVEQAVPAKPLPSGGARRWLRLDDGWLALDGPSQEPFQIRADAVRQSRLLGRLDVAKLGPAAGKAASELEMIASERSAILLVLNAVELDAVPGDPADQFALVRANRLTQFGAKPNEKLFGRLRLTVEEPFLRFATRAVFFSDTGAQARREPPRLGTDADGRLPDDVKSVDDAVRRQLAPASFVSANVIDRDARLDPLLVDRDARPDPVVIVSIDRADRSIVLRYKLRYEDGDEAALVPTGWLPLTDAPVAGVLPYSSGVAAGALDAIRGLLPVSVTKPWALRFSETPFPQLTLDGEDGGAPLVLGPTKDDVSWNAREKSLALAPDHAGASYVHALLPSVVLTGGTWALRHSPPLLDEMFARIDVEGDLSQAPIALDEVALRNDEAVADLSAASFDLATSGWLPAAVPPVPIEAALTFEPCGSAPKIEIAAPGMTPIVLSRTGNVSGIGGDGALRITPTIAYAGDGRPERVGYTLADADAEGAAPEERLRHGAFPLTVRHDRPGSDDALSHVVDGDGVFFAEPIWPKDPVGAVLETEVAALTAPGSPTRLISLVATVAGGEADLTFVAAGMPTEADGVVPPAIDGSRNGVEHERSAIWSLGGGSTGPTIHGFPAAPHTLHTLSAERVSLSCTLYPSHRALDARSGSSALYRVNLERVDGGAQWRLTIPSADDPTGSPLIEWSFAPEIDPDARAVAVRRIRVRRHADADRVQLDLSLFGEPLPTFSFKADRLTLHNATLEFDYAGQDGDGWVNVSKVAISLAVDEVPAIRRLRLAMQTAGPPDAGRTSRIVIDTTDDVAVTTFVTDLPGGKTLPLEATLAWAAPGQLLGTLLGTASDLLRGAPLPFSLLTVRGIVSVRLGPRPSRSADPLVIDAWLDLLLSEAERPGPGTIGVAPSEMQATLELPGTVNDAPSVVATGRIRLVNSVKYSFVSDAGGDPVPAAHAVELIVDRATLPLSALLGAPGGEPVDLGALATHFIFGPEGVVSWSVPQVVSFLWVAGDGTGRAPHWLIDWSSVALVARRDDAAAPTTIGTGSPAVTAAAFSIDVVPIAVPGWVSGVVARLVAVTGDNDFGTIHLARKPSADLALATVAAVPAHGDRAVPGVGAASSVDATVRKQIASRIASDTIRSDLVGLDGAGPKVRPTFVVDGKVLFKPSTTPDEPLEDIAALLAISGGTGTANLRGFAMIQVQNREFPIEWQGTGAPSEDLGPETAAAVPSSVAATLAKLAAHDMPKRYILVAPGRRTGAPFRVVAEIRADESGTDDDAVDRWALAALREAGTPTRGIIIAGGQATGPRLTALPPAVAAERVGGVRGPSGPPTEADRRIGSPDIAARIAALAAPGSVFAHTLFPIAAWASSPDNESGDDRGLLPDKSWPAIRTRMALRSCGGRPARVVASTGSAEMTPVVSKWTTSAFENDTDHLRSPVPARTAGPSVDQAAQALVPSLCEVSSFSIRPGGRHTTHVGLGWAIGGTLIPPAATAAVGMRAPRGTPGSAERLSLRSEARPGVVLAGAFRLYEHVLTRVLRSDTVDEGRFGLFLTDTMSVARARTTTEAASAASAFVTYRTDESGARSAHPAPTLWLIVPNLTQNDGPDPATQFYLEFLREPNAGTDPRPPEKNEDPPLHRVEIGTAVLSRFTDRHKLFRFDPSKQIGTVLAEGTDRILWCLLARYDRVEGSDPVQWERSVEDTLRIGFAEAGAVLRPDRASANLFGRKVGANGEADGPLIYEGFSRFDGDTFSETQPHGTSVVRATRAEWRQQVLFRSLSKPGLAFDLGYIDASGTPLPVTVEPREGADGQRPPRS